MKKTVFWWKLILLFSAIAIIYVQTGCESSIGLVPQEEMTPEQRALFFMSVYNKEYENYLEVASRNDLTEEQKQILRKKKKILFDVYPLLENYADSVHMGVVPDKQKEDLIIKLLDEAAVRISN